MKKIKKNSVKKNPSKKKSIKKILIKKKSIKKVLIKKKSIKKVLIKKKPIKKVLIKKKSIKKVLIKKKSIKKKSIKKVLIKKKGRLISKIIKLQYLLKPEFNLKINFSLEKYIQGFFDKIANTILDYKILKRKNITTEEKKI